MSERKALDSVAYMWMMVFCICFALQAISLKATSTNISPIMHIALRSFIGTVLVLFYMAWVGEKISNLRTLWIPGLFSGLLYAVEYVLMGEALRLTAASRVTVFMYSAPLFAALFLHFLVASERLSKWQWCGALIAFGGIIVTFWESEVGGEMKDRLSMLAGDLIALFSGLLWGLNTAIIRTSALKKAPIGITSLFHLIPTFVVLYIAALILGQSSFELTNFVLLNLGFQSLFIACGGFLLWFWLLRTYVATRISIFSFLTPLFTIVLAILLLDEPIDLYFIIGAVLVVGGLIMISLAKNIVPAIVTKEAANG